MKHITSAVGRNCPYQKNTDVITVQKLLNRTGAFTDRGLPLKVDGAPGTETIRAIEEFQRTHFGISDGKVQPGWPTIATLNAVADEFQLVVATVHGEAARSSETAWKAILWVMKNRIGTREWAKYSSLADIIQHTGFDACTQRNAPYRHAFAYMDQRAPQHLNASLERVIRILRPIYEDTEADITNNAVLYYSPKAQSALHKNNPKHYAERPKWNFSVLTEVKITGLAAADDFKFYAYK